MAGWSVSTNGTNGYGHAAMPPGLSVNADLSVSMWQYGDIPGAATFKRLVDIFFTSSNYAQFTGSSPSIPGRIQFGVTRSGTLTSRSSSVLNYTRRNHVLATWRPASSTLELWINGILDTNAGIGGQAAGNTVGVTIGRRSDGNADTHWAGSFDDVRIYTRALASDEIAAIYSDPWAVYREPQHYWIFGAGVAPPDATITQTLPRLTQAATGTQIAPSAVAQQLPGIGQSATAISIASAAVAQTLPRFTQSAAGSPVITAAASQFLPRLSQSATASLGADATIAQTLPKLGQSAAATPVATGVTTQQLPSFRQSATGTTIITGALAQTLPSLKQSATATVDDGAAIAQTLPRLGQSLTATTVQRAQIEQSLPRLQQLVIAYSDAGAVIAQTLPRVGQSATGTLRIEGAVVQTLPRLRQAAVASSGEQIVMPSPCNLATVTIETSFATVKLPDDFATVRCP